MQLRRRCKPLTWLGLAVMLLALVGALLSAAPAHAAASRSASSNDTLTLSLTNGTTFTYGSNTTPTFQAVVVLATPLTANYLLTVFVKLDSGQSFANSSAPAESSDNVTYTFSIGTPGTYIPAGSRIATASFTNPSTNQTTQGSTSLTITKANFNLACGTNGSTDGSTYGTWKPGQKLQITLAATNLNTPTPDWTQGTATITFQSQAASYNSPSLQPDSSGVVTATTPPQVGRYNIDCTFTGTDNYATGA